MGGCHLLLEAPPAPWPDSVLALFTVIHSHAHPSPAPPLVHSAASGATSVFCPKQGLCPHQAPCRQGWSLASCLSVQAVLSEPPLGRDSTGQASENASLWQEVRRASGSPCFRRQLRTSCSPFPFKTKQRNMGLNCSKGDLGQIEEKPVGATSVGTVGADGISCPGDLWQRL